MKRWAGWGLPLFAGLACTAILALFGTGFFAPTMALGFVAGFIVRRWSALLVPAVIWTAYGVFGVIGWISGGAGNPVVMFGLIGLYLPIPLGLALTVGVALGSAIWPPRSRGIVTEIGVLIWMLSAVVIFYERWG